MTTERRADPAPPDSTPAPSLKLISASAGTGKTHALTSLVWRACGDAAGSTGPRVRPEGLVGVTFTEKAAAELGDRIRRRLFLEGAADSAQRLPLAYLGTVHGIGLRLICDYAFEAGVSPEPRVLPDDGDRFAHTLLERAMPVERERTLALLGRKLGVRWDVILQRSGWQLDVLELVRAARANRIAHTALPAMAARAWRELRRHLPDPIDARDFEAELLAAIETLLDAGLPGSDSTDKSARAFAAIAAAPGLIRGGAWSEWLKLSRLEPGKGSLALFAPVTAAADMHRWDPRFHADLERYITEAYAAAADAIASYANWKGSHKTIDWIDMLDRALQVLDVPEVARDIGERIDLVVVDELQDSGPLQVALFARLHGLAGRSTWVGDPKQCIFEWNGADPGLIDALVAQVPAADTELLSTNYRSRPALVQLVSDVFGAAFEAHGMDPRRVAAEPSAARLAIEPALAALPPLGIAWIDKGSAKSPRPSTAVQLAQVVAALLAAPDETRVLDRQTGQVRPLAAGDIALLVRSNATAESVASALRERGIRVSVALPGLLDTAEGRALQAGLRLVVARDPLAEAELEMLHGCAAFAHDGDGPEQARERWLARRLVESEGEPGRWSSALGSVRAELLALSPAGVVDRTIDALDLTRLVREWGAGGAERVANLDAIRALARTFENEMQGKAQGATLSGLVRYLAGLEERGEQHVPENEAGLVTVATYHKAKGLEWPVVVLADLGHDHERSAFEVWAESEGTPSLTRPLEGRWVRYWPWPYGLMRSGPFKDDVAAGATGQAVSQREQRERARILYVGFTRARDHLVLAVPRNAKQVPTAKWLDSLGTGGKVVFDYASAIAGRLQVHGLSRFAVPCRVILPSDQRFTTPDDRAFARATELVPRGPRRLAPSKSDAAQAARLGAPTLRVGEVVPLGTGAGTVWLGAVRGNADRAGDALHAFLAGDAATRAPAERRAAALAWLAAYEIDLAAVEGVLTVADRFWAWLRSRWSGAKLLAEVPIHARIGEPIASAAGVARQATRVLGGSIDLLIETEHGLVLVDHKSGHWPVPADPALAGEPTAVDLTWARAKALGFAPQLATYRAALQAAGARVLGSWIHLASAGIAVELRPT